MSISRPFFNSSPAYTKRNRFSDLVSDEEYLRMHWTRQEQVRRKYHQPYIKGDPGDFDNRTDNWDDPEINEQGAVT